MKKVISMLLFVAAALSTTSCDEAEEIIDGIFGAGETAEYVGQTNVSSYGAVIYTLEDSSLILEEEDDTISLEMVDIQFSDGMPAMDIKISDIPSTNGSFSIDSVVPTLAGVPMESYTITDVSGNYSTKSLSIEFVCLTLDVSFSGNIKE
ncbi:MAG: hypothetical protein SNI51_08450 [Rikenellaceae bacterium]